MLVIAVVWAITLGIIFWIITIDVAHELDIALHYSGFQVSRVADAMEKLNKILEETQRELEKHSKKEEPEI